VNVDAVPFLGCLGSGKSRARSAELPAGGKLGGADGVARHHRPNIR
jgi:hypothetical protein